jgi:hypothetical protein
LLDCIKLFDVLSCGEKWYPSIREQKMEMRVLACVIVGFGVAGMRDPWGWLHAELEASRGILFEHASKLIIERKQHLWSVAITPSDRIGDGL